MRKLLLLVAITFTTGEDQYTQDFQVLVEATDDATYNDLAEQATKNAIANFPTHFPESTIVSVVPRPTL